MDEQATRELFERIRFRGEPLANPVNVVTCGAARFTLLTPRLVRLEWAADGRFEDHSTYAFPTRYGPPVDHTTHIDADTLVIGTEALELRYRVDGGRFTAGGPERPANLSITFRSGNVSGQWAPGMPNPGNLRGTLRTLDGCEGDAALGEGLVSRAGWALFDDTRSVVFEDGWVAARPDRDAQDWYFACYGHDYKAALAEYTRFGGAMSLIPRFVLGAWWSRYWEYSAQDLMDLVCDFERYNLPLDVLVVDMDWHTPPHWTGYTWNRQLFPDPEGFLGWVHDKGLRATFNLHPAEGVGGHEEIYPRFAEAMGVDPAAQQGIPFRITDKKFVKNYFTLLHHTMEAQGVDFWWMDWQQGDKTEMAGLDALPWLNHLHFHDSTRRGGRAMLYSRWGGLGNHRYHIGFSGDTFVGWPALQFQPYLTATAANVAYGWWSHDIGGHMGAATEPELYARWVQFGALSPVLRLHSTKDARFERRPWKYPEPYFRAAQRAFHLRYRLIPYLYTMARVAADTSIALCRPMYYESPEDESAYAARYQYYFGDQMIAAPIVTPVDPRTGLANTDVWLPAGEWIDFETKETHTGPAWVRVFGDLERMPMFVKAGGIIPQSAGFEPRPAPALASGSTDALAKDKLVVSVFPGASGRFRLYEDDGASLGYAAGECEWTEITTAMTAPGEWQVTIGAVEGRCPALPAARAYEVRLEGSRRPARVLIDGAEMSDWSYDAESSATVIQVPAREKTRPVTVMAAADGSIGALGEAHNWQCVLADVRRLFGEAYPHGVEDAESLKLYALFAAVPGKTDVLARLGGPLARVIEFTTPEEAACQLGRVIVGAPADGSAYDLRITFTLEGPHGEQTFTVVKKKCREAQVVNTPFAFDGRPQTLRWSADVNLSWRGGLWTETFRSAALFPTIHAWRVLYDRPGQPAHAAAEVVDAAGRLNESLAWDVRTQDPLDGPNLRRPFVVRCGLDCIEQLRAGEPAGAWLAATVVCPDEREVALLMTGKGAREVYLNGLAVVISDETSDEADAHVPHPRLGGARRLAGLRLLAGENTLVIRTTPGPVTGRHLEWEWTHAAAFVTLGGESMPELGIGD
jgi:hypothetical protein